MNPKHIIAYLEKEKRDLERIISDTNKRLANAPKGNVKILKHRKGFQFYVQRESFKKNGEYLPVSQRDKGIALIRKNYDQKILAASEKQVSVINRFLEHYKPDALKNIYASMSEIRKSFLTPVAIPDLDYVGNWQEKEYNNKSFWEGVPEQYTSKGERVRSKSEVMIADALYQAGIPYRYECPLQLEGQTVYPDFTILRAGDRQEIYWEHLGMMDDPEYCVNALKRSDYMNPADTFRESM